MQEFTSPNHDIETRLQVLGENGQALFGEAMQVLYDDKKPLWLVKSIGDSPEAKTALATSLIDAYEHRGDMWPLPQHFENPNLAMVDVMKERTRYIEETYRYNDLFSLLQKTQGLSWESPAQVQQNDQASDTNGRRATKASAYREGGLGVVNLAFELTDESGDIRHYKMRIGGIELDNPDVLHYALGLTVIAETDEPGYPYGEKVLLDIPDQDKPEVLHALNNMVLEGQVAELNREVEINESVKLAVNGLAQRIRGEVTDPVEQRNLLEGLGIYE